MREGEERQVSSLGELLNLRGEGKVLGERCCGPCGTCGYEILVGTYLEVSSRKWDLCVGTMRNSELQEWRDSLRKEVGVKIEGGKNLSSIKFLSRHHPKGLKGTLGSPLLRLACSGLPASSSELKEWRDSLWEEVGVKRERSKTSGSISLPASGSSWPLTCSWGDVPECGEGKSSGSSLAWPFPLSGKLLTQTPLLLSSSIQAFAQK